MLPNIEELLILSADLTSFLPSEAPLGFLCPEAASKELTEAELSNVTAAACAPMSFRSFLLRYEN
ncbi:MAG: hypothetical protein IJV14_12990 [Lachnospiraceae bacterium]|nr:hypothetical protein [Lachnospiraceae bacterium]